MLYYLIVCRSLTFAQRTAAVLGRAGIPAAIRRTPAAIAERGCSYSVKLSQKNLSKALVILRKVELTPRQIYITEADGSYREVSL
ncbi:MAG: DUF3343 domain-containing protein [Oscillospiraceae bacterium]|nr:DUF3343 domain-containing protein [Oscillospiraceae bacterium]